MTTEARGTAALAQIDHIVVLMLENRSFDHMLGYLSLTGNRPDVRGLTEEIVETYGLHRLERTAFEEWEDPPHDWEPVSRQMADRKNGFVETYLERLRERKKELRPGEQPVVMGYYDADHLPVYDFLAERFCVCDSWFASVPGPTWPNRCYAVAGESGGYRDNRKVSGKDFPLYYLPSFVRHIDDWRWYSAFGRDIEVATGRAVDPLYLWEAHWNRKHFALFAENTDQPSFLEAASEGTLPAVSWIDPNFFSRSTMLKMLAGQAGEVAARIVDWLRRSDEDRVKNDDHPPGDVRGGQALVRQIVNALVQREESWDRTLLVVVYDEHGGFFDHEPAPYAPADERPQFRTFGIRVPALIVSPRLTGPSVSSELAPGRAFDHASIIKTILARFAPAAIELMGARVREATSLAPLLDSDGQIEPQEVPEFETLAEFELRPGRRGPFSLGVDVDSAFAEEGKQSVQASAVELVLENARDSADPVTVVPEGEEIDPLEAGMLALAAEAGAAQRARRAEDTPA